MTPATTPPDAPRPIPLLDLGNVLFAVHFERALDHWARAAGEDPAEVRPRFAPDHAYGDHETGRLPWEGYRDALGARLRLDLPDETWREGWALVVGEVRAGVPERIEALRSRGPVHAFSNTNPLHLELLRTRFGAELALFDRVFASCELGHRKPDPDAFHAVASALGVPPDRLVFLDDTDENVNGARIAGLRAHHVPDAPSVLRTLDHLLKPAP